MTGQSRNGKVAAQSLRQRRECGNCPDFFDVQEVLHHCLLYALPTEDKVFWTTGEYDTHRHRYIPMRTGVLDHGAYYAPKSFLAPDGRRILWGWIRETRPEVEFAAAGWSGAMALPRVLTVNHDGELEINTAIEVEKLRGTEEVSTLQAGAKIKRTSLATLRRELRIPLDASKPKIAVRLLTGGKSVWELLINVPASLTR